METKIKNINRQNKSVRLVLVFWLILLVSLSSLNAQQLPNDCASTDPCNEPWNETYCEWPYYTSQGTIVSVRTFFFWRWCNGQVQIMIDWSRSEVLNGNFFNRGQIFEKDIDGARQFVELSILEFALQWGIIWVPNCNDPDPPRVIVTFYTARCGVWVKCSYVVDPNTQVEKDDCYQGDCPSLVQHNGAHYIDVWRWQPCGTTCCKKQYELCKEYDFTYNYDVIRIRNVTRTRAPGFTCSEQGNCHDWRTGQEYQCQDGCEGDGN